MTSRFTRWFACLALWGLATLVMAAPSFGPLTVNSPLGEPLDAVVRISNLPAGEMTVTLASAAMHRRYGMDVPLLPDDTTLLLGPLFDGERELRLRTPRAAHEPVLSLVISYVSGAQSGTKVFTALVNPLRPRALALRRSKTPAPARRVTVTPSATNSATAVSAPAATARQPSPASPPTAPANTKEASESRLAAVSAQVQLNETERGVILDTSKSLGSRMQAMTARLARMQASRARQDARLRQMQADMLALNQKLAGAKLPIASALENQRALGAPTDVAAVNSAAALAQAAASAPASAALPDANEKTAVGTVSAASAATNVISTQNASSDAVAQPYFEQALAWLRGNGLVAIVLLVGIASLVGSAVVLYFARRTNTRKRQNRSTHGTNSTRDAHADLEARAAITKKAENALAENGVITQGPATYSVLDLPDTLAEMVPVNEGSTHETEELAELLAEVDVRIAFGETEVARRNLTTALRAEPANEALARRLEQLDAVQMNDDEWLPDQDDNPFEWDASNDSSEVIPFKKKS